MILWAERSEGAVVVQVDGGPVDKELIWMHELAHVLGLGHVGDFGPGDREGLWKVGAAHSCIPDPPRFAASAIMAVVDGEVTS